MSETRSEMCITELVFRVSKIGASPFRYVWIARKCLLAIFWCLLVGTEVHAATYTNSTTTYNWIDPGTHTKVGYNTAPYKFNGTGCGTAPPTLDDTISDLIPIGWNFLYGATSYNGLRVMTNGRLQFNNTTCGSGTASVGPPQTYPHNYPGTNMNNTMKAFGVDLDPTNLVDKPNYPTAGSKTSCTNVANCYISYASIGTAPNRQFVVSWVNVPEWVSASNTSGSFTFQIILNEDGGFVYQYKTIVHGGTGKAQIGWQLTTSVSATGVGPYVSLWTVALGKPIASGNLCVSVNLDGTATGKQCTATGAPGATATSAGSPWLRYPWTGTVVNPVARATLGIYKSPLIYRRENY